MIKGYKSVGDSDSDQSLGERDWSKPVMICLLACFTLLSFAARVDFVAGALPCNSPLRTRYPQHFSHCPKCSYTQWTTWSVVIPVQIKTAAACDSDKAKKYERTRTPLPGAVCKDALQKNTTYKCKYGKSMHGIKYIFYMFCTCWFYVFGRCANTKAASWALHSISSPWSKCWWANR